MPANRAHFVARREMTGRGAGAPAPLQRPLPRGDRQVNGSTFAFLFAEMIAYFQQRITSASDLENRCGAGRREESSARAKTCPFTLSPFSSSLCGYIFPSFSPSPVRRLQSAGFTVGQRYLELVSLRERPGKRETTVVGILQFLSGTVWMQLFGKTADALEKSTDTANACELWLECLG